MNYGESKTKAIKLINEYSNKGAVNPATKIADYMLRFPDAAQAAQMEIATVKKIHAVYNISKNPITPQGGLLSGFEEKQFLLTDNVEISGTGSRAYYFEVDRPCTVYIEEEKAPNVWTILTTLAITGITSFTASKGLITPSNVANTVRLRFSGLYPYNMRYRALWEYPFSTSADVPDYRPYVKYDLPADAMEIKKIIREYEVRQYGNLSDYYIEGKTTVVVNYYYAGSFRVEYFRYPTAITSTTDDNFDLELDREAQELVPYSMAASVLLDDKETRPHGTMLLNIYQSKLANLSTENNESTQVIQNITGW